MSWKLIRTKIGKKRVKVTKSIMGESEVKTAPVKDVEYAGAGYV